MRIVHIFDGPDGQSHFDEVEVPLRDEAASYGTLSPIVDGEGVIFRQSPLGGLIDFHPAPRQQFVVTLSGRCLIDCGNGEAREFGPGDVMFADDLQGRGHITREIEGQRESLILPVREGFDLQAWVDAGRNP